MADPISTSREIKLALLKAFGIDAKRVFDVELDLSDTVAKLKVTVAVPAIVNGLIVHEVEQYELVRREQAVDGEPAPTESECSGPIGFQPIGEQGSRWICGLSASAAPGSPRCDSALLRACGSEAPQCPRRDGAVGAS